MYDVTLGMPENMELGRSGWVPVFSTVRGMSAGIVSCAFARFGAAFGRG
jgi:hypothetical protein